jgi:glycosyltransferase involved in cell wall biosynthesis
VSEFEHAFLAPAPAEPVEPGPVPTFSIVIAAYQAERHIGAALESALAQTLPPVEVVVCDDGSTDGTAQVVAPYRDRGVVYLRQENNGEPTAKNAAVRAATGDFVVLLDSDDEFLPRRLEALGALASARPDLDVMTTDAYVEVDGEIVRRVYDAFGPERLMWGTDWPLVENYCGYAKALALVRDEIEFLNEEDKAWMLSKSIERVWPFS